MLLHLLFLSFRLLLFASCPFTTPIPPGGVAPLPARPSLRAMLGVGCPDSLALQRPEPTRKRPWRLPGTHERLLLAGRIQWESSLSDRIANSDPFWARACILSKAFWADKGQNSLFLGKSRFQWADRPQGVPLEVGGPPERNATGSWRAARKECPLEGGQAKTDRTPKTPRMVAW